MADPAAAAAMQAVLDFSTALDVGLLDSIVAAFYDNANASRDAANDVLMQLREHPEAWTRVDAIIEGSNNENTKFYALQILQDTIQFRWGILPVEQREGVRTYIVDKIIALSADEETLARERLFVSKLNLILVQVLKHEWPHKWASFIPDLVGSSKTSVSICENNMHILKLLSEEVFDFSKDQMTSAKVDDMKKSLNHEFSQIFQLCEFILGCADKPSLITVTLQTLLRFLSWIPLGYIFETKLIETLINKYFAEPMFRCDALACLTEVGSIDAPAEYHSVLVQLYLGVMGVLVVHIPPESDISALFEEATEEGEMLIQRLSLFFTGFFKAHRPLLEAPPGELQPALMSGMDYLVRISDADEDEIFKICLEYWHSLTNELYLSECRYAPAGGGMGASGSGLSGMGALGVGLSGALGSGGGRPASLSRELYGNILSRVRLVMISHMAKPEEVLIKEDEGGDIVRETTKDTDALAQYKTMRETLVYLTHLDYEDTEKIMLDKLARQVDDSEWGWNRLNTLCWAVGSISGAMSEDDEKRFVVTVIKDLLKLCEMKKGKKNKAVIASCIMYVVGQYPRFLRKHWKFLRTVVNKLFEFMHEKHPGVQDMACDTFLKIAQKCKRMFVMIQSGEARSFVDELCDSLPAIINDLEMHQIHTFYEATACMVSAHPDTTLRASLIERLMALPNAMWVRLMAMARERLEALREPEAAREAQRILRTNVRVCKSVGASFQGQMGRIFFDVLNVYKAYSEFISRSVEEGGEYVTRHSGIKLMRAAKREVLALLQIFVERAEDRTMIAGSFIPHILDPVLGDYQRSIAPARDTAVLECMAAIVGKLREEVAADAPRIIEALFGPTLEMITSDMEEYPETRVAFYTLLDALNTHCFAQLVMVPPVQQKLTVDSVVWAIKHTTRDVAELGLSILHTMLNTVVAVPDVAAEFFAANYINILQDVLYVLTDRMHKSGFKMQVTILRQMLALVEEDRVPVPLWDTSAGPVDPAMTNSLFMREHVRSLLASSFENLTPAQVDSFVVGLFDMSRDLTAYKTLIRDFLIELLEFKGDDNAQLLYSEEAALAQEEDLKRRMAVPGLVKPAEVAADDDDL